MQLSRLSLTHVSIRGMHHRSAAGVGLGTASNDNARRRPINWQLTDAGCVTQMTGGRYVTLALRPEALADDCARRGDRHATAAPAGLRGPGDRSGPAAKTRYHAAAANPSGFA